MNLAKLLFKPKWQDKDAVIRRNAVANDNDAELINALPEIIRGDADPAVRLAALKRLNDYELWRERSTGDADHALRRTARTAYISNLCADTPGGPALPRRIAELETLEADELETVASSSVQKELRAEAMRRIGRAGFLAERALHDPDSNLRLEALQRIADPVALDKIAERARKTDKNVSRQARALAEALRVESGDASAIAQRARALCDRMELLMRTEGVLGAPRVPEIDDDWRRLGNGIPADVAARYDGARAVIVTPPPTAAPELHRIEPEIAEPVAPLADPNHTESLISKSRFDAALAAARAEAEREQQRQAENLRQLSAWIPPYEAAIEAGDTAQSAQWRARIDKLAATIGDIPPEVQRSLEPLHQRTAHLQRWADWSGNQRRRAICADIESLPPSMHPDALATRIREYRDEWQKLAATNAAPEGLERRFQALSNRTLKTARPYFDKRDEVRRAHTEAINQLVGLAEAIGADNDDWKSITALRAELGPALRTLDQVDPRERTRLAKRIKLRLDDFDTRIKQRDAQISSAKARLIELAKSLVAQEDARDIAKKARQLQSEWTALGNGHRSTDQKQWREFRAACDAAFGNLDAKRKAREEQSASVRIQAVAIIEEFEALAASGVPADALRAALKDFDTRWSALSIDERNLEQRFRQARESVSRAIGDAARRSRLARFTSALRIHRALRNAQSDEIPADEHTGDRAFDTALEARRARGATALSADDLERAAQLLVQLEFLAGVESPASERQRRMDLQVQKLSSRMRGGAAVEPQSELAALFVAWFSLPGDAPMEFDDRFESSARVAIDNLP